MSNPPIHAYAAPAPILGAKLGPRVDALDLLRGVAILGIFLMNTQSQLLPCDSYTNPNLHMFQGIQDYAGDFHMGNAATYIFTHLFADVKFISIFSLMFGAGIMLQGERVASRGMSPAVIHYRRMTVLLIIALMHAYLIWYGDILTEYALCGLCLFPLRKLYPQLLMGLGVAFVIVGLLFVGAKYSYTTFDEFEQRVDVFPPSGEQFMQPATKDGDFSRTFPLNWIGRFMDKVYKGLDTTDGAGNPSRLSEPQAFNGVRERVVGRDEDGNEIKEYDVIYWSQEIRYRTICSLGSQFEEFPKWSFWRCGGCILIGMALQRWRFFHGSWGKPAYWTIALFAIPTGMGMTALGIIFNNYLGHWDYDLLRKFGQTFNYLGSFIQALGYMCVGVLVAIRIAEPAVGFAHYATTALKYAVIPIRSVGKMALSNYLFQNIVGTTLAYAHRVSADTQFGFSLYGKLQRYQLLWVVLGVWTAQMILSVIWLQFFRQGPVEWAWHKLAYFGQTFPLRPAEDVARVVPASEVVGPS